MKSKNIFLVTAAYEAEKKISTMAYSRKLEELTSEKYMTKIDRLVAAKRTKFLETW